MSMEKSLSLETGFGVTPDWRKDLKSILLLVVLYFLQGIPLGIAYSIPFLLQSVGVTYSDQAVFAIAYWPFAMKILQAPLVDALYFTRLGRRKSWLLPLQYMISLTFLVLAFTADDLLASKNVSFLAAIFFVLMFLTATQDIVVDGWSLSMLRTENVGYASSCQTLGQHTGRTIGHSVFLGLHSVDFANKFRDVPGTTGLITLPQFCGIWAVTFALITTLIFIFKTEKQENAKVLNQHMDILGTYKNLWRVIKLPPVRLFTLYLMTIGLGTATLNTLLRLKLVDQGVPKETIAFFEIPSIALKLLLPLISTKLFVERRSFKNMIYCYPVRLTFCLLIPIVVCFFPIIKSEIFSNSSFTLYTLLFLVIMIDWIAQSIQFLISVSFSNHASDPTIGGTYVTLLNTLSNVGGVWPTFVAFWLVDRVGIKVTSSSPECIAGAGPLSIHSTLPSETVARVPFIITECVTNIDGYYVLSLTCFILGTCWIILIRPTISRLSKTPKSSWMLF